MIRTDLRKTNPIADIISVTPNSKMKRYYEKRLRASLRFTGYFSFPENLTNRTRVGRSNVR